MINTTTLNTSGFIKTSFSDTKDMTYLLITIKERELWNKYIHASKICDFYHSWYYHSLEKNEEPFLFVYCQGDCFIAFPLLKRKINNSEYYDCTSVYGYAGPVSNVEFSLLDVQMVENFREAFLSFLKKEKFVSVFSRLHPIINQDLLLSCFGGLHDNGKTVVIDLQIPLEEQRKRYRRQYRQKIRQLREKGYCIKEASTKEEIERFVKIYNENMARVKAGLFYHFDEYYFFNMLNAVDFESGILLLCDGDEITSGACVTYSNNIMQLHLAATNNAYLQEGPMKLLIDEAAILGRRKGIHYLHLGGGVGGHQDSLFEFKSGFSNTLLDFKTWRFIANIEVYNQLVEQCSTCREFNTGFFPLYREQKSIDQII
ncbi:MAG TPA: GNAT family N-acetyltransferase [Daejeonella sp.]|nr:GNAT family N-acetyltransferase [Daejeonella sp.]